MKGTEITPLFPLISRDVMKEDSLWIELSHATIQRPHESNHDLELSGNVAIESRRNKFFRLKFNSFSIKWSHKYARSNYHNYCDGQNQESPSMPKLTVYLSKKTAGEKMLDLEDTKYQVEIKRKHYCYNNSFLEKTPPADFYIALSGNIAETIRTSNFRTLVIAKKKNDNPKTKEHISYGVAIFFYTCTDFRDLIPLQTESNLGLIENR